MSKLKKLDASKITSDMFNGIRSYGAAMWAIEICNKIIDRVNEGYIVFEYENIIKPKFELRFDKRGYFDGLYLKDGEGCWVWIVGDVRSDGIPVIGEYNTIIDWLPGKVNCTKKSIREFFKLWRVAEITNVSKVSDLTK